uniref:Adiponectin receptor 2 n=1 Tax=Propithecus coquereli TaxID=379532 RepID=A0A2K6F745_PROCO
MNEPAETRLGCSGTPEPDIRLRKGHQLDGTRGGDNDNHQGDLEPILEASVRSSHHKKVSNIGRMVNKTKIYGDMILKTKFRFFYIHSDAGNNWGCVFFLCLGIFYMFRPNISFVAPLQEKVVFGLFFLGAILCLSFSWLFHTVYCHSEGVSRLFSKLDYSGIALLIMGSFVPWLYYSFYCNPQPCFIYLIVICVLGIAAIIVSQWDMFATPQYRGVRAGVFLGLGLSGIIPTLHYVISEGFLKAATIGQIGWLLLMASLYITGAALYAARIPERFFPGKCDIWFHSHQLFHIFVVAGAFVHFHGVSNLQEFRFMIGGGCSEEDAL